MNDSVLDLRSLATEAVRPDSEIRLRDLRAHAEMDLLRALMDMRKAPERTGCSDRGSAKVGGEKK
jgi:hypothetical protein